MHKLYPSALASVPMLVIARVPDSKTPAALSTQSV